LSINLKNEKKLSKVNLSDKVNTSVIQNTRVII